MESVRIARLTTLEFHTRHLKAANTKDFGVADGNGMFIDVVVMGVMQMTIMEIVNVSVVSHSIVSALRIVRVSVCGANRTFRVSYLILGPSEPNLATSASMSPLPSVRLAPGSNLTKFQDSDRYLLGPCDMCRQLVG